jgi:hypothetical protein
VNQSRIYHGGSMGGLRGFCGNSIDKHYSGSYCSNKDIIFNQPSGYVIITSSYFIDMINNGIIENNGVFTITKDGNYQIGYEIGFLHDVSQNLFLGIYVNSDYIEKEYLYSNYESSYQRYVGGTHIVNLLSGDIVRLALKNTIVVPSGSFTVQDYSFTIVEI